MALLRTAGGEIPDTTNRVSIPERHWSRGHRSRPWRRYVRSAPRGWASPGRRYALSISRAIGLDLTRLAVMSGAGRAIRNVFQRLDRYRVDKGFFAAINT
jgi:hypothetical protein